MYPERNTGENNRLNIFKQFVCSFGEVYILRHSIQKKLLYSIEIAAWKMHTVLG
jgi:hypothetical protein